MKSKFLFIIAIILFSFLVGCSSEPSVQSQQESPSVIEDSISNSSNDLPTQSNERNGSPTYILADFTVIDDENCMFSITKIESDGFWGFTVKALSENKTDVNLMFSWDKVSVNGYMIDPFWAKCVEPKKRAYSEISFSNSSFEENGISNVEEIEFELRVYLEDDWSADNICKDVFTYTP